MNAQNYTAAAGAHTHTVSVSGSAASDGAHTHTASVSGSAAATGSGDAHDNIPPWAAFNFIIKAA